VKPSLAATVAVAAALLAPVTASAATLSVSPVKPCYRAGESFSMAGSGFTPGGPVDVTVNDTPLTGSPLSADLNGAIGSTLTLGQATGQGRKTLKTTDVTDIGLTASVSVVISAVSVKVTPRNGAAGKRVRIKARGFTTGKTLYAHVRKKGRVLRNVKLARVKGACGTASVKRRLFSSTTKSGVYKVQFDTNRRYSAKAVAKSEYTVPIFPMARDAISSRG
jgi:hypothetical protein